MAISQEAEYVHLQPRNGNKVDVWRLSRDQGMVSHETFKADSLDEVLQGRLTAEHKSLKESEVFLGLNVATAAILFIEAIRRRSKSLAVASLVPVVGAVYAGRARENHWKEIVWVEKEMIKVEEHNDLRTLV